MSGNPNFRDPAYRDRALRLANEGKGKAHASWDRQATARRQSDQRNEAELDHFDLYVMRWEHHVKETNEAMRYAIYGNQWEGFEL